MSPRPTADSPTRPYEVAIVGNDAVLAALPARPMQLAHAILACGYDLVVPVSWGEEALAEHALRVIAARGSVPAIYCACPSLRARLLSAGSELAPYMISLVAPSVATARYLRALQPDVALRITMIGGCPGARDLSIDTRVSAQDFLRLLVNRGISLARQPAVFDSVIPPDRRRFFSLPGGCPAPKALETRAPERRLVTITDEEFSTELAEHLLSRENILIDLSSRLGCTCCGGAATGEHWGPSGQDEILQYEPPRAPTPILDLDVEVPLDMAPLEPPPPAMRSERANERASEGTSERTIEREGRIESIRLPGASPIAEARQRAERRRIAVTPPAAMAQTSALAEGQAPPIAAAPAVTRGHASTPMPAPLPMPRGVGAGLADLGEGPVLRAAVPPTAATAAVLRGDAAVLRPTQPEPDIARGERPSAGGSRTEVPIVAGTVSMPVAALIASGADALPPDAPATDTPADIPVAAEASAVPEPEDAAARSRRSVPHWFHLSRSGQHPRATVGEGRVLPRAYIRHTPVGGRLGDERTPMPDLEVERALDVVVEPIPTLPARASTELAVAVEPSRLPLDVDPIGVVGVGPVLVAIADAPTDFPAEETSVAPPVATIAGGTPGHGAPAVETDVAEAPTAGLTAMPPHAAAPPQSAPQRDAPQRDDPHRDDPHRNDPHREVLARVRLQAQRPSRVLAREVPARREPRLMGSLTFFIAATLVVVLLLVALAVVFRRAPTAPW